MDELLLCECDRDKNAIPFISNESNQDQTKLD